MWLDYAKMELEANELARVEQIFNAALPKVPNVDLWNLYVDYLRRRNPMITDVNGTGRQVIQQAFEYVLERMGGDPDSAKLWREYVDFVKSGPGTPGGPNWQDAQKMDLMRKAYQKAITLPHGELTKLWKEYDNFELGLNKATGRKFLQDKSPAYMTARTAYTQLSNIISVIDRSGLPKLPPVFGFQGDDEFGNQVEAWRRWIAWEKDDPLVLRDEDAAAYRARVLYVYKQATMALRFYPEMWFESALWCFDQSLDDLTREGDEFLDRGMEACPESVLLALKKADRIESTLESGGDEQAIKRRGDRLEVPYESVLSSLYALAKATQEREKTTVARIQEAFAALPPESKEPTPEANAEDDDDEEAAENPNKPKSRNEVMQAQINGLKGGTLAQMENLKRTISFVWIAMMRAFRRIQGHGKPGAAVKGSRGVFAQSRPRGMISSDVYIASALMEYYCYKDPAATKIFERGLKLFPTDENFALEYIKHLINLNDLTNARAVFETTITKLTNPALPAQQQKDKCRPLLAHMHAFESAYGDLAQIARIEKRMAELYPEEHALSRFGNRFATPAFDATRVQLIISPTQARPKLGPPPNQHRDPRAAPPSPPGQLMLGPNGPYVASPKRGPPEDSDTDTPLPAAKYRRADSPLKGAAGRRLAQRAGGFTATSGLQPEAASAMNAGVQALQALQPPPAPLHPQITWLLSRLPNAREYRTTQFDAGKVVGLLRGVELGRAVVGGGSFGR